MVHIILDPMELKEILFFARREETVAKIAVKDMFVEAGTITVGNSVIEFKKIGGHLRLKMITLGITVANLVVDTAEYEINVLMRSGEEKIINNLIDVFFSANAYYQYENMKYSAC